MSESPDGSPLVAEYRASPSFFQVSKYPDLKKSSELTLFRISEPVTSARQVLLALHQGAGRGVLSACPTESSQILRMSAEVPLNGHSLLSPRYSVNRTSSLSQVDDLTVRYEIRSVLWSMFPSRTNVRMFWGKFRRMSDLSSSRTTGQDTSTFRHRIPGGLLQCPWQR